MFDGKEGRGRTIASSYMYMIILTLEKKRKGVTMMKYWKKHIKTENFLAKKLKRKRVHHVNNYSSPLMAIRGS